MSVGRITFGGYRRGVTVIEWLIGATIIGIIIALITTYARRDRFMKECMRDHKEYECEVLWQQSQPQQVHIYRH